MEHQLQKIAISGPTLASLLQRFSSSPSDMDGLLFGHVTLVTPTLTDDSASSSSGSSHHPHLIATITSFLSFSSPLSFYDPLGNLHLGPDQYQNLLGWFSARRRSALRPSMRELSVSSSLSNYNSAAATNEINTSYGDFSPCIFLLLATPVQESLIHTHDYRPYQFVASTSFEAKSVEVVNIGPAFRGHYENFSPTSPLPVLNCEMSGSSMVMTEESLRDSKEETRDQKQLDKFAEGFQVRRLRKLLGSESTNYTAGLEDMYEKMLAKIESLARQVEISSAKVLEQENHNRKLRYKVIRTGLE